VGCHYLHRVLTSGRPPVTTQRKLTHLLTSAYPARPIISLHDAETPEWGLEQCCRVRDVNPLVAALHLPFDLIPSSTRVRILTRPSRDHGYIVRPLVGRDVWKTDELIACHPTSQG
jgi:hypothetical protein